MDKASSHSLKSNRVETAMESPYTTHINQPMTRGQQIRALMLELNISYNAARCRIDPEFHEKQKEYSRQYAAKKKQECPPKESVYRSYYDDKLGKWLALRPSL